MIRSLLVVIYLASILFAREVEATFENSNFTLLAPLDSKGNKELLNYNRFRLTGHIRDENWFVTAITDIENYIGKEHINSTSYKSASSISSDTHFSTQSNTNSYNDGEYYAQLYRMYAGYANEKHRISFGIQKVSMGVGRIWNPTDLFNPKNPLALEPDEVFGAFSLFYTYSPSELSEITIVGAKRADKSFKYAGRIKGYLEFLDVALNIIDAKDATMVGYELEGELFESSIELRSEGGWFDDKLLNQQYFQGLIGADYAFINSLILTGEWLYTSKIFKEEFMIKPSGTPNNLVSAHNYFGLNLAYQFDSLLFGSLSSIVNIDDGSSYITPVVNYSFNDDTVIKIGTMLYRGKNGSEFGDYRQTYYLNINVTF